MYNLVINKYNAGEEAIKILNNQIKTGEDAIAKIELKNKTIYIITKNYLSNEK